MTLNFPVAFEAQLHHRSVEMGFVQVEEFLMWLVSKDFTEEVSPESYGLDPGELENRIDGALDSGSPIKVTPEFWSDLWSEVETGTVSDSESP